MPFARAYRDRDWMWIVDTGASAAEETALWKKSGTYQFSHLVRLRDAAALNVVAGERHDIGGRE